MGRWIGALVLSCLLVACGGDDSEGGTKKDAGLGGKDAGGSGGTGAKDGGGGSGGTGATSTGGSGGCTSKADCPAPSNECESASCANGTCGTTPVPAGTATSNQVPNDCKRVECDGAGKTQDQPDDTDIKDDQNPCTTDGCSASAQTHAPVSVGTSCNGASYCNAQGQCVQCLSDTNCGAATECATPTCTNGACSTTYKTDGTSTSTQSTGDCKKKVCDGSGGVKDVNDDTDVSDDNNPCTIDSCDAGTPKHANDAGKTCGTNGVCNSLGQCVGCNSPSDCPGTDDFCKAKTCTNNLCGFNYTAANTALPASSQVTGDCATLVCDGSGATQKVANSSDALNDNNECTDDQCVGTTPQNPAKAAGAACTSGGGKVCDGAGACVACLVGADCGNPVGYPCVTSTCTTGHTCATANAPNGTVCGAATCTNGIAQLADKCDGTGSCADGGSATCSPYVCGATSCTTTCSSDAGCATGYACDTGLAICATGPKCTDYCNTIMQNCTGAYQQYSSMQSCLGSCADLPRGNTSDTGGNTVGCRSYHAVNAAAGPSVHCPHAGPGGAGVCGANCDGFCTIALLACTGSNQQYSSMSACLTECATFPTPIVYSSNVTSGNSLACRLYHLTQAVLDPVTHCPHITASSTLCQ